MYQMREFNLRKIMEGEYYPGSFIIAPHMTYHEMIERVWEADDYDKDYASTLLHEYIHFMQNISTVNGMSDFFVKGGLFEACFALIAKKEEPIKLPLQFEELDETTFQAYVINDVEKGSNINKKIHHVNRVEFRDSDLNELLEIDRTLPEVVIHFNDEEECVVGSTCIMESMAYLMERIIYGSDERKKDLPYNACEIICQEVYPEILANPKNIVALCELSLMYPVSGIHFYRLLNKLKEEKMLFDTVDEVIEYFNDEISMGMARMENIQKNVMVAIEQLYPSDIPYTKEANELVHKYFHTGYSARKNKPLLISQLLEAYNPHLEFLNLFMIFGDPIIVDPTGKMTAMAENVGIMPAPLAIFNSLLSLNPSCPMKEYCKNEKMYKEAICKSKPWKMCRESILCPYALYLKWRGADKEYKSL